VKCCSRSTALHCGEIWTLRKVDQKDLESFEMCYWRRKEKNNQTSRVTNEKVLHTVKKDRIILHTVNRRRAKRVKTQFIFPFIVFGYMFRIKSVHHQVLKQDKQQV